MLIAKLSDAQEIVDLVNSAYRGEKSKVGWTTEADLLDGQRVDIARIHEHIETPNSVIGMIRSNDTPLKAPGTLRAVVHLEKKDDHAYLGMLTVSPEIQNKGLGKDLLLEAENFCKDQWKCKKIQMTVISVRDELISYYKRRGYSPTGETKPFPYGDSRFGIPKVQNLEFVVLEKLI